MRGAGIVRAGALALALSAHAAGADGLGLSAGNRLGGTAGGLTQSNRLVETLLPVATKGHAVGRVPTGWFWQHIAPVTHERPEQRWAEALGAIAAGRAEGRAIWGSETLVRRILSEHGPTLRAEADRRDVALPLLLAVIAVESSGNPRALSPMGAGGLMQLMPQTARRFGVADAYAPGPNIRGGATYLDWLLRRYRGDAVLALAGYNAGEGAVDRYGGVPPYRETRDYVAKVAGAFEAARRLCAAPPDSARGPCEVR